MSVLEPAGVHTEVETGGDPLDRQEADLVRRTLKYRCGQTDTQLDQQYHSFLCRFWFFRK